MAKFTQAEKEGIQWGAVGVPAPFALQSAVNKLIQPEVYASVALAQADLAAGEAKLVIANNIPTFVAKNRAGSNYKLAFTAGS